MIDSLCSDMRHVTLIPCQSHPPQNTLCLRATISCKLLNLYLVRLELYQVLPNWTLGYNRLARCLEH